MVFFFQWAVIFSQRIKAFCPWLLWNPPICQAISPGCHPSHHSTEMTAHNATCLPHIGVGILRKVADAKFEVPEKKHSMGPIPRKIQKQQEVQRNDVVMDMDPWILETHVTWKWQFQKSFQLRKLSNLPQTTEKTSQLSNLEPILRVSTRVYIYIPCTCKMYWYHIILLYKYVILSMHILGLFLYLAWRNRSPSDWPGHVALRTIFNMSTRWT